MTSKRNVYFPKSYFSADNLPPEGLIVRIAKFEQRKIGPEQRTKLTIWFHGQEMGFVCNVTNFDLIAAVLGTSDEEAQIGKRIELYPTTTIMQGKTVACVRVRAPTVKTSAQPVKAKTPAPAVSVPAVSVPTVEAPPWEPDGQYEPDDEAA